ncbi:conserved hypothetical protein [Xanthomonas citri pv. citri]|nr:conserved hypothetical protein [Xanthomonas citri pv. citri]
MRACRDQLRAAAAAVPDQPVAGCAGNPVCDRCSAFKTAARYHKESQPPGLPRRDRPHRAHAARPGQRARSDEPSAGHPAACFAPGTCTPGGVLTRNGWPRAQEVAGRRPAARTRQDRRAVRHPLTALCSPCLVHWLHAGFGTGRFDCDGADIGSFMTSAAALLRDTSYKSVFEPSNRTICIATASRS